MGSHNICSICQEVFLFQVEDTDEQPYALKCGHVFHNKCLSQWKANVNKCPQCRATAQNPIRLFFISDSDINREEPDVFTLQAELDREKSNNLHMKKKFEEMRQYAEISKEKNIKLQVLNDELEHLVPSLKEGINTFRKENKSLMQTVAKLNLDVKKKGQELEMLANIKDILNESVDSIAVEKYKNMKPDMVANIVNQWKRNAQYYKQKEASDRQKYTQLQEYLKKYKQEALKYKNDLLNLKEEVKVLRNAVGSENASTHNDANLESMSSGLSTMQLKRRLTSPDNESPLVKKLKITNVLALNQRPVLSTVHSTNISSVRSFSSSALGSKILNSDSKPVPNQSSKFVINRNSTAIANGNTKSNPNNSIFKKTHSLISSRDIFNHYDG